MPLFGARQTPAGPRQKEPAKKRKGESSGLVEKMARRDQIPSWQLNISPPNYDIHDNAVRHEEKLEHRN